MKYTKLIVTYAVLGSTLSFLTFQAISQPAPITKGLPIQKLAGGFKFNEGPLFHPRGFLLFSDEQGNTVYKYTSAGKIEVYQRPANRPNGLMLDKRGNLLIAQHETRSIVRKAEGKTTVLAERFDGKRLNSPNDMALGKDGSIYFTDPPFGLKNLSEGKELAFNGVYRLSPSGKISLLVRDFALPNGIVFSPDGQRLYVNDSAKRHIRVFQVGSDGTLSKGRVFAAMPTDNNKDWGADGMEVDAAGNLYSVGAKGVWMFAPSGKLLGRIYTPEVVTNLEWGDSDRKTLYMTGLTSLYKLRRPIGGAHHNS